LHLKNGWLEQVLPQFHTSVANIHAVYPQRLHLAAKVCAFVALMALSPKQQTGSSA
jgi:hypothetical protein